MFAYSVLSIEWCGDFLKLSERWKHEDRALQALRFSAAALDQLRIEMHSGSPRYVKSQRVLPVGTYTFVIGPDDALYAVHLDRELFAPEWNLNQPIFHSSFFGDQMIKGAGEFRVDFKGFIDRISDGSGHFQPNVFNLYDSIMFFKELGAYLPPSTEIELHLPESSFENPVLLPIRFFLRKPNVGDRPLVSLNQMLEAHPEVLEDPRYSFDFARALLWTATDPEGPLLLKAIKRHGVALLRSSHLENLSLELSEVEVVKMMLLNVAEAYRHLVDLYKQEEASVSSIINPFLRERALAVFNRRVLQIARLKNVPLKARVWFVVRAQKR